MKTERIEWVSQKKNHLSEWTIFRGIFSEEREEIARTLHRADKKKWPKDEFRLLKRTITEEVVES